MPNLDLHPGSKQRRRPRTQLVEFRLPPDVQERQYLTLDKAAEITGIPYDTIYWWVRNRADNGLLVLRRGKRLFLNAGHFARWLEQNIQPW